jgi:hypothetical protein
MTSPSGYILTTSPHYPMGKVSSCSGPTYCRILHICTTYLNFPRLFPLLCVGRYHNNSLSHPIAATPYSDVTAAVETFLASALPAASFQYDTAYVLVRKFSVIRTGHRYRGSMAAGSADDSSFPPGTPWPDLWWCYMVRIVHKRISQNLP